MWHRLPLKLMLIFAAVAILATLHFFFIDDYGSRDSVRINFHVPGWEHIGLASSPKVPEDTEEYVAFCLAVKDQPLDLPEFLIHHYYNIGIRRFYIMDDGSDPPLSTVSDYGIPNEALTFHYYNASDRMPMMQLRIYNQCNQWYGANHTWIAYIDTDEFLEVAPDETLHSILKTLEPDESIGALGVNWRIHTSSDLQTRPESNRKSFTTCIFDDEPNQGAGSDNKHVKSIVKTSKYQRCFNPHTFVLKDGAKLVGENGDWVNHFAFRQPITRNRISLHHYAVKSYEEYEAKLNRSNAMGDPKTWEFWDHVRDMPHVDCPEMLRYDQ